MPDQAQERQGMIKRKIRSGDRNRAFLFTIKPHVLSDWPKAGAGYHAIANYSKAIEINPRFAEAYNNRGLAYAYKGQYGQAISDYNKAIETNPKLAEAYYNRGAAYYLNGEHDKACKDVRKAQSLGYPVHQKYSRLFVEP
jgi:tetratricopeptide (TPR) repeat protein